jgi:hypothetical protein
MRQRFLSRRGRSMARRPGEGGRLALSPRALQIGGWVAALLLVLGIAGAVRLLGDSGDGATTEPSQSAGTGELLPIVFGTALSAEGVIPVDVRTTRFGRSATFAYAVDGGEPASAVHVEVERLDGGPVETVQPASVQRIANGPGLIGFTVPAAALLDAWGPGSYVMRIYLDPQASPIAEGRFVLVEADPSP